MRKIILAALAAIAILSSCKKEDCQPNQPSGPAADQFRSVHIRVETSGRWNGIVNSIHVPYDTANNNLSFLHWNFYPAMSSVANGVHVQDYYLDSCRVGHRPFVYLIAGVNSVNNPFQTYQQYIDSAMVDSTFSTNWYSVPSVNADSTVAGDWVRVTMIQGNDTTIVSDTLGHFNIQLGQFQHTNQSIDVFLYSRLSQQTQLPFPEYQINLPLVQ